MTKRGKMLMYKPFAPILFFLLCSNVPSLAQSSDFMKRCMAALPTVSSILSILPENAAEQLRLDPDSQAKRDVQELIETFKDLNISHFENDVTVDNVDQNIGSILCSVTRVTDMSKLATFAQKQVALSEKYGLPVGPSTMAMARGGHALIRTGQLAPINRTRHRYIVQDSSGGLRVTVLNKQMER